MNVITRMRPIETIERLRWGLPVLIFLFVVVHQLWEAGLIEPRGPTIRFVEGVLVYGLIGPFVTWWVLTWIGRNLRQQESIEQQMRQREQYLASITTASADAIISVDNSGCIQSWNQGAERMFGWSAEEIVGQPVNSLVPPERLAEGEPTTLMQTVAEAGFVNHFETERVTRDGQRLVVEVTSHRLTDSAGRMIGSATIIRDITARKRAEEQILNLNRALEERVALRTSELQDALQQLRDRADELERANQELTALDHLKSEFVSMVSHELRAPLTNINGSVELLMSEGGFEPSQRTMLQIIGDQTQRLTRLVQGILNVSRIEAGRLHLRQERLDLRPLIQRVAQNVRAATARCLDVSLPAEPVIAWADADRVEEILTNLIDNAFKYSAPETTVRVSSQVSPDGIVIAVSDTGVGIPPDQLDHIFEKFHRVEQGDNRETYGYGLGLYIARGLVEALGGRIWAESTPGEGSTFYFTLPLAPQTEEGPWTNDEQSHKLAEPVSPSPWVLERVGGAP
ncbi:MAG: MEKHLA domain-containing protein [Anaerolineae bacterium]|nr:MEKHLA domain-containing protein [Anaerolineae bacterium]